MGFISSKFSDDISDLKKIPVFNPKFVEAYSFWGILLIFIVSTIIFGVGLLWISPWNMPVWITPEEIEDVWVGIVLLPFGAIIAGSFCCEFVIKFVHLLLWTIRGRIVLDLKGNIFFFVFLSLATPGTFLLDRGNLGTWGFLLLFLSLPLLYGSVIRTWDKNYEEKRPNNSLDSSSAETAPSQL